MSNTTGAPQLPPAPPLPLIPNNAEGGAQQNTENNQIGTGAPPLPPKDKQNANLAKHEQLMPSQEFSNMQKSYYFSSNDRFDQEQYIMKPLTAPSDDITAEKVQILRLDPLKTLSNQAMLGKLRIDGVYCDRDPRIHQLCTDNNVLRFEQRLLREKPYADQLEANLLLNNQQSRYFKMNGELKLHNDLLADEITRPADLAFEQSEAYQTKEVNAILSDRMHSFKKNYYRLDIVVGTLNLQSYPSFFSVEDRLSLELREMFREWERRTSLALIPFYIERLKFMEDEQYKRHREGGNPLISKEDNDFLTRNIEETHRKLEQEKREVQELADILYRKWKQIKELRKTNQYASTNIQLKVTKSQTGELYFNLMHEDQPSAKLYSGQALPHSEISRRNNAMRIRAYVRLIINGRYVTRSRKAFLKWPSFEIEFTEQFQICLFTMPSSIQLEIVIGGAFKETLVDVIDLEVPGSHVKALTSAATQVKKLPFSKRIFDEKKQTIKKPAPATSTVNLTEDQQAQEKKKKEEEEKKAQENDVRGFIFVKAEWKGEGAEMPPMRSENVFKQSQPQKNRKQYSEEEQSRMLLRQLYIDVNDPRNERIIKLLKETKNEFLLRLLREDAKNPVSHLKPFRHLLLEARAKDPDLQREQIPFLEQEVINNPHLLDKLEVLFREQAFKEYLEKKIEEERSTGKSGDGQPKVYNLDLEENAIKFDNECIRRRQMFFDKLKNFQREIMSGSHQKSTTQYKSIIREFELLESENPLLALFNKMFISGRKLRPVVQKRQPVSLEACKTAKILVHVVKGFNVPIRNSAKQEIQQYFQRGNAAGMRSSYNPAGTMMNNPYGRSAGPFPTTFNQLQGTQLGGMGNQFDPRQSFMGGGGPGQMQFGYQSNFGNDRMMGGIPLNNTNMMGGQRPPTHIQEGDIRQLSEDQLRQLYRTQRVEPIVEVRIVYNEDFSIVKLTNVAEGDYPEWNEILEFPLQSLNKRRFTKQELINTKAMIYVTLFDKEISTFNTGRIEMEQNFRYLGSFSIPLISLLNNPPKIDAIFKVNRPLALFNYQVETNTLFFLNSDQRNPQLPGAPAQQNHEKVDVPNTYISMSISLDPVLELPQENELEYYIGLEKQNLLAAASEWTKSVKKGKFEKRNIKCFGENVNGQSVLLCRYILPQAPPLDIYDKSSQSSRNDKFAIEKAARYVSLIPLIEDNQAFNGQMPDLWCTSQEFLDLGAGDFEEHAILLCNYFNFIDQHQGRGEYLESFLCLGLGYPEGKTAYVMRRDKRSHHVELWNPMRGEAYFFGRDETAEKVLGCISVSSGFKMNKRMNDAICQLKALGCIIGSDNIWANVQEFDDPALLSYDLTNSKCWKPFFTKSNRSKYFPGSGIIQSEQVSELRYMKPMEKERADIIAIKIQNYITEQFETQRIKDNRMRTKWNNQMETILNSILARCEMTRKKARLGATNSSLRDENAQDEDVQAQLNAIQAQINSNAKGQKSWGFPINSTFISLPMLWEEVKNTKIHMVYDDDAEFSLYVYVEPYSHNVLSVWFYLLVLTKDKRRGPADMPF